MRTLLTLLLLALLFGACSSKRIPIQKTDTQIRQKLYSAYKEWKKTPYLYGGSSKRGVDCSSLIQSIYKENFNLLLPRTSYAQTKVGYRVSKSKLKAGDLLFFKTGSLQYHSGIYIGRGEFIHSSSTKGVTISNIHNPYWRSRYKQARRVLPQP